MTANQKKGWCVAQANSRNYVLLPWTFAQSRREAKRLWCKEIIFTDPQKLFAERVKDGSLRYAQVCISEVDATP